MKKYIQKKMKIRYEHKTKSKGYWAKKEPR